VLSLQSKTRILSSLFLALIVFSLPVALRISSAATSRQTAAREISFPVVIHWNKRARARKYRLQIAADQKFHDIFFDAPVIGERYVATELPAGYYFWRVAPAGLQLGSFSAPVRIFVSGGIVTPVSLPNRAKRAPW
jgi:hypothetical protein